MTKIKQVVFAAGLVAVGYRLGAKSPAVAAAGGSMEFRDEVTPSRSPSSKTKASSPESAKSAPSESIVQPSEPAKTQFVEKTGQLIRDCGDYSSGWTYRNITRHLRQPEFSQVDELRGRLADHWAQAFQQSTYWKAKAYGSIDGSQIDFTAIYYLKMDLSGNVCWETTVYASEPKGISRFSGGNRCADGNYQWANGDAVQPYETYHEAGLGELVSAIIMPADPFARTDFEYLTAADEKWISGGMMYFEPVTQRDLVILQAEMMSNAVESEQRRAPASNAQ